MSTNEIQLNNNDPDSIYNWLAARITSPEFRNVIKDYIDENCSSFIDVEENTFEQGQLFNEFTQLVENLLNDVLEESHISQETFLKAAQRGLEDPKYKKYFQQMISFSDYNYFKSLMCRRNYALIKQVEEQFNLKQGNNQQPEAQNPQANQINNQNQEQNKKSQEEINQELFEKHLREQEENDLQQALKDSLMIEEQQKRMREIEDEELRKAIDQSLEESKKKENEKKENEQKEKEKKEKEKKLEFSVQKTEFDLKGVEPAPKKVPQVAAVSSNDNFQFTATPKPKEEPKKTAEIISASKGFDFQVESKNKDFGFSPANDDNPYARPQPKENKIVQKIENSHAQQDLIDEEENEKPKINKNVPIPKEPPKNEPPKSFDLLTFDDKKPENIEVAKTISLNKNEKESASSILKNAINQEQNNNNIHNINEDDGGGLLIDEDEEENNNQPTRNIHNEQEKQNTFIDKKKDINLGKINFQKGDNFMNNNQFNQFGNNMNNYQVGGMQKLENNLMKNKNQGAVISDNDEDFMNKLKEVEMEKQAKMRQYREELLKMKKDKREKKANEVLSPEELAKLQQKQKLAEALKAKRK